MQLGIKQPNASYLISVIGISSLIGNIGLGCLSDRPWINRLYLYSIFLVICGLSELNPKSYFVALQLCINPIFLGIIASNVGLDYISQIVYCVFFGATSGSFLSLTPVILIDLIGMDSFIQAYGIQLLCFGLARIIGPPIIGNLMT